MAKRGATCIRTAKLPRWNKRKGWTGGDDRTLYAFTDNATGSTIVRPVYEARSIGQDVTVRVATKAEAEKHWQKPLHAGWKVKC